MIVRVVLLALLNNFFSDGFNFDTDFPIVYSDPSSRLGIVAKSTYFGYSTIMYSGNNHTKPWIQIGSPRGQDPNIQGDKTGVIFRCPLFKDCTLITIDKGSGYMRYGDSYYIDERDRAWIGSAMDIDVVTDIVVVCGFRSCVKVERHPKFMMGSCYWSHINDNRGYRKLLPLLDPARFHYRMWSKDYYNFALGQSGFSAHLTLSKDGPELVLGGPGILNWEGTAMVYKNLSETSLLANVPAIKFSSGSLDGYAVTSGHYFGRQELLYVSGSPKKNRYLGQVLVFNFNKISNKVLDVRDSKQGSQTGEYFGAALASGDVNMDGYTDLFVGAPFYKDKKYNEGRVYIFYGHVKKSLTILPEGKYIKGTGAGGQFGSTIAYLGDFDLDGFGDIAIAAPYEDKAGVIYIFRGSTSGIILQPSQVIAGKSIIPNLRGFGISFSKLTDIDRNGYEDLAVGAHLSEHAIILRARPVLHLRQSFKILGGRFVNSTNVEICLWFQGSFLPKSITVNRTITLDKNFDRVTMQNPSDAFRQEILENQRKSCTNYTVNTVLLRDSFFNLEQPVNLKISQTLAEEYRPREPFIIGTSTEDKFCATCPVMGPYKALDAFVPFALGCGDDNICNSELTFDTKFNGVDESSTYVIGSTEFLRMDTMVYNNGEKAYSTRLIFELPERVYVALTPKFCIEGNSSGIMICQVANPLHYNETKIIPLTLNMNGILSGEIREEITFVVRIATSGENLNRVQEKSFVLKLISEADVLLTGKSNQPAYSYGNVKMGNSTFSQIYQIQKIGKSPVDEVILHLHIPISIKTVSGEVKFLKLHPTVGILSGQPINCKNLTYVDYVNELIDDDSSTAGDNSADASNDDTAETQTEAPRMLLKRSVNFGEMGITYTNNLNETDDENGDKSTHLPLTSGDTFTASPNTYIIDCTKEETRCATIRCSAGPFRSEQHVGVIQMKAFLDVSALEHLLDVKTKILIFTSANVTTENFSQSGNLPDHATVSTIFVGELISTPVAIWIVILTIIVGLLILLILTLGLYKAGFFKREKKIELEALKKAEVEEEFLSAGEPGEKIEPEGTEKRTSTEFCEMTANT